MPTSTTLHTLEARAAHTRFARVVRSVFVDPVLAHTRAYPISSLGVAFGAGILLASGVRKPVARLLLLAFATRLVEQL
ncbi:MAG: hypothetical protein ACHREM_04465 [Polyangiales bacterium]